MVVTSMKLSEFIEILKQAPPDLEVFICGVPPHNIAQFSPENDGIDGHLNIDHAPIALDDADQVYYRAGEV